MSCLIPSSPINVDRRFYRFASVFPLVMFLLVLAPSTRAEEISIMVYNLCNYFVKGDYGKPIKSEEAKNSIVAMVKTANPDVLLVSEMGREMSLDDLRTRLELAGVHYGFTKLMTGADRVRHLAVLSKVKPSEFNAKNDLTYKIRPKKGKLLENMSVSRGFLHLVFTFKDGYRLDVVSAHLKSRVFHNRYNQTDMRRYEARLLRYYVDDIIKKNPKANVLVLGDLNDTFESSPIQAIRADDKARPDRLFDLRPVDQAGMSWTHWWNAEDSYGRIDYALANDQLLPEIDFEKSRIHHVPEYWMFASDHRPLLIVIDTGDKPPLKDENVHNLFPDGIYHFDVLK